MKHNDTHGEETRRLLVFEMVLHDSADFLTHDECIIMIETTGFPIRVLMSAEPKPLLLPFREKKYNNNNKAFELENQYSTGNQTP